MIRSKFSQGQFSNTVSKNLIAAIALMGICTQGFASPHHMAMTSAPAKASVACVFPDGTSPAKSADLHCYDPASFMKAYGIDKLHDMGLTGKGQTIILADSFGSPTLQQDLDHFSDTYKLPRTTIKFIYPNGKYVNPLANDDQAGWAEETTLDLEWAHAVAPDATLVNIVTSSSETVGLAGFPDLFAGFQMAVEQYPGAIISMSFGTGEPTFTADDIKNYLQGSFHKVLQQGTFADVTFLASAGDSGSTNMNATQDALISSANASYPASDPLITAVGGTSIQADWTWNPQGSALDYWNCSIQKNANCPTDYLHYSSTPGSVTETVWKEDWALAAGGGGVSTIFGAPSFQSSLDSVTKKIMNGHRSIPDVSLNAAINGGVSVYTSFVVPGQKNSGPKWQQVGGTSCAAPETAGLVALAGEKASELLGRQVGIGFLNSTLYSLKSHNFNDIVTQKLGTEAQVSIGDNSLFFNPTILAKVGPTRMPPVAVAGYATKKGYDMATGLGTPRALNFVLNVARARSNRDKVVVP